MLYYHELYLFHVSYDIPPPPTPNMDYRHLNPCNGFMFSSCLIRVCPPPFVSISSSDNTPLRSSLVAESNVVELFREEPEEDLGLRIVGGKDTPLGNIVIQEIVRDSQAARDGRLAPGDHILEVRGADTNRR